jgi:HK97 gp10 family phage protein
MARRGSIKRFQERMQAIPKAVRAATQPAVLKGAHEIADLQRRLAPKDTGDLAESIVVTGPGESTPPYSQPGGTYVVPENAALVTAGNTDVRYAHLVEYGTVKSAAHPFFWPAFRTLRKRTETRIKRAMSKAVKDNWG